MSTVADTNTLRVSKRDSALARTVSITFIAVWCIAWFVHAWGYYEDDSYIHLDFARSFAQGKGFAFQGHVVYGDTSPIWVFLLIGFHRLIPDWIVAGKVLAALGAAFALVAVYLLAKRFSDGSPHRETLSLGMVLLFAVNPYFCFWSFSGMEAVTAAGVACLAVLAANPVRPSWWKFLCGCALCGIAPLLRPEMVFLSVLVGLLLLRQLWQLRQQCTGATQVLLLLAGLVLTCAPVALWANYALHAFGAIIPTTNAAKRAVGDEKVPLRLLELYCVGFPVLFVALLSPLLSLFRRTRSPLRGRNASRQGSQFFGLPPGAWVFFSWTLIAIAFYIKDRTHVQTRYIVVNGAGTMVTCVALLLVALGRRGTLWMASALFVYSFAISAFYMWPFVGLRAVDDRCNARMAEYINRNLPAGTGVADYSIGQIAFLSDHPIIDTGGITRPESIFVPPAQFMDWLKSQGAQYEIAGSQPEPGAVLVHVEKGIGWDWRPGHHSPEHLLLLWKLTPPNTQK